MTMIEFRRHQTLTLVTVRTCMYIKIAWFMSIPSLFPSLNYETFGPLLVEFSMVINFVDRRSFASFQILFTFAAFLDPWSPCHDQWILRRSEMMVIGMVDGF
jgi:hypothetical protein